MTTLTDAHYNLARLMNAKHELSKDIINKGRDNSHIQYGDHVGGALSTQYSKLQDSETAAPSLDEQLDQILHSSLSNQDKITRLQELLTQIAQYRPIDALNHLQRRVRRHINGLRERDLNLTGSGLDIHTTTTITHYYDSPKSMLDRVNLLEAAKRAGDHSPLIDEEERKIKYILAKK